MVVNRVVPNQKGGIKLGVSKGDILEHIIIDDGHHARRCKAFNSVHV